MTYRRSLGSGSCRAESRTGGDAEIRKSDENDLASTSNGSREK